MQCLVLSCYFNIRLTPPSRQFVSLWASLHVISTKGFFVYYCICSIILVLAVFVQSQPSWNCVGIVVCCKPATTTVALYTPSFDPSFKEKARSLFFTFIGIILANLQNVAMTTKPYLLVFLIFVLLVLSLAAPCPVHCLDLVFFKGKNGCMNYNLYISNLFVGLLSQKYVKHLPWLLLCLAVLLSTFYSVAWVLPVLKQPQSCYRFQIFDTIRSFVTF